MAKINELLTSGDIRILRDIIIFELNEETLLSKYNVTKGETANLIQKVHKKIAYQAMKDNYTINMRKVVFGDKELEKAVWQDYIRECIEDGETTGDIARRLNRPLEFINSCYI